MSLIVVNLFAGPGSGKSTTAAYLFYYLKTHGCNVELVREYAKDLVYEGSYHRLANQVCVTAEQYKRVKDIASNERDGTKIVITDSPLAQSIYYAQSAEYSKELEKLIIKLSGEFENFNVLIKRVKEYNPRGRMQTAEESDGITDYLRNMMLYDMYIDGNEEGQKQLAERIMAEYGDRIKL